MVNTMISHLRENKPDLYKWDYTAKVIGDTVVLSIEEDIDQIETVKNEITSTLTLNSFSAVCFQLPGSIETLTLNDINIPLLDLVSKEPATAEQEIIESESYQQLTDVEKPTGQSSFSIWLIVSVGLNILLIGILIYRLRK